MGGIWDLVKARHHQGIRTLGKEGNAIPLKAGKSKATISANISEMVKHGYSQKSAVAASLNKARESGAKIPKKKG